MNWYQIFKKSITIDEALGLPNPTDRIILTEFDSIGEFDFSGQQKIGTKPNGLWYAMGNEWIDWCRSEMPEWLNGNLFELIIDDSSILKLSSYEDLVKFTKQYGNFNSKEFYGFDKQYIDWKEVAQKYLGIEISPYIYEASFDLWWYSGWDVASGCIWDSKAISKRNLIGKDLCGGKSEIQQQYTYNPEKENY